MLDFSVTFIITIINITILFFILRAILFKPVTKFIEQRAKRLQDSFDKAEKDKAEAKKLLVEYEDILKRANAEAQEIIAAANTKAARQAEFIIAEGKAEAERIAAASQKQIETEHQQALAKFRLEAAALVIAASSRLAAREMSSDDTRRYANMLFDELSGSSGFKGNLR